MEGKIVHWNIRGYYGNFEDLKILIRNSGFPDCICLQETLVAHDIIYPPSGYYAYHTKSNVIATTQSNRLTRGTAILIKKNIPHSIVPITSEIETQAVKVHLSQTYTIVNLYISPQLRLSEEHLNNIISQIRPPFLILGDFNARSPAWGDSTTNDHGTIIERQLLRPDLTILNTGSPTHYHIQTNSTSCIDLSLTSSDSFLNFYWEVFSDSYRSDHFPVTIREVISNQTYSNERYNFNKADWDLYESLTHIATDSLPMDLHIDTLVTEFTKILTHAADASIRKSNSANRKYPIPWWNQECQRLVNSRKTARRKYRRTGLLADKIDLNRITAKTK